jgi:hypothetical protein
MVEQTIIIPSNVAIIYLLKRQIVVLSYKESRRIHIFRDTGTVVDYVEGINGKAVDYKNITEYNNAESEVPALILPNEIVSKKLENGKSMHILTYAGGLVVHIDQDGDVVIKISDDKK